jgi:hypothetical protein
MTNLLRSICTICFCSTLILSCKKNKDGKKNIDPCDQITKVILKVNPAGVLHTLGVIEYDEGGRVKYVKVSDWESLTYTYFKDSILLVKETTYNGLYPITYYLDANGRIKGTSLFDNQYTYNEDGYLTSFRRQSSDSTNQMGYDNYTLKYENGDCVELISTNKYHRKVNFKYYDEANQEMSGYYHTPFILDNIKNYYDEYLIGAGFFGKNSAHLYKNYREGTDIKYNRDAKGRITSSIVHIFEYQCP